MTPAEKRLVEFVVWEMRRGDLPADVQDAAEVCAASMLRPEPLRGLTEGPLIVSSFPADESQPIETRHVFPHQAGQLVTDFLRDRPTYVLVTDTGSLS